ncbi:MAG: Gfo/Idh/MocA family oxidoreductase [Erysipelotrichaceae bacterium]|nr:Gfo/Idh/MocA family oxidoreductase [Erysipelotrichaceae bacterium]
MIRAGIFGIQVHTGKFIDLLRKNGVEVCVCWNDEETEGRDLAREYSLTYEEDLLKAMDDYDIDTAIITVGTYLHEKVLLLAAQRDLNIFLEKPLCISMEEADNILEALKASKGKFYMSEPFVRSELIAMKHLIEEGKLGQITSAYFRIGRMKNWDHFDLRKQQGGTICDFGVHGLHMIQYLFGRPEKVISAVDDLSGHKAEDNVTAIFTYPSGLQVCYQSSYVSAGNTNRAAVYGTKGFCEAQANVDKAGLAEFRWTDGEEGIKDLKLPEAPMEHIDYFVKMIKEDLPNEIVGQDEASLLGVNAKDAYGLTEMIHMIYEGDKL